MRTDPGFTKLMRELHPQPEPRRERGRSLASSVLERLLSMGPMLEAEVIATCATMGITRPALRHAKRELNVQVEPDNAGRPVWYSDTEHRRWR
jgi:hypothetical protein